MVSSDSYKGVLIALVIIMAWFSVLLTLLFWDFSFPAIVIPFGVLLMTHLYTGLFITAHDAMHGVVSPSKPRLNKWLGSIAALLFAFNSYNKLLPKHHEHHKYVATDKDPDYADKGFLGWYFKFVKEYVSWWQILFMAVTFNILKLFLPTPNLLLFWILPSILATLQLFYFGTYLPHKGEHPPGNTHKARSQKKNHIWAFLSCYFFGYHYEHHDAPWVPWWQLYRQKELSDRTH
jgi:beta-carotene ketolase (CrtW type)